MNQRILVVGLESDDQRALCLRLAEDRQFEVVHYQTSGQALSDIQKNPVALFVFSLQLFNRDKLGLLNQLRDQGHEFPILVSARAVSNEAYRAAEQIPNAAVVESPIERKRLLGVTRKLLGGKSVRQQQHRRFVTDQAVSVEPFRGDQEAVHARIRNLSAGGAFIECVESSFVVGDLVRFHVSLNELSKKHTISAQVMWRSDDAVSNTIGYGVSFMRSGDVYQNLLKRI